MVLKKIFKPLFVSLVIISFSSCNSTSTGSDKKIKSKNGLNEFQAIFVNMRSSADKLVFKRHYLNPDSNIHADYDSVVWVDPTNDLKRIDSFDRLFTDIRDGGYCCCRPCHYTVSFYKDNNKLGFYCVDTSGGTATFFDESWQTSYRIDLNTWNSYLLDK